MRKKTIDTIPILSNNIKMYLLSLSRSRSLPESLVKRSKIILLASQGSSNQIISQKVGLHYNHVATWRNRFLQALPFLQEIEASSPEKLEEEIRRILSDRKRSGTPPKFTPEQILAIIDLACKSPCDFGYEVSQWSLPLLVKEIQRQKIADRISAKSVSRFLKMR